MVNEAVSLPVGNYNYTNQMYNQAGFNMPMAMGMNGSLFGGMAQTGLGDYSNDIIAPDFMKQNYCYNQNYTQQMQQPVQTQAQTQQNSVFTTQPKQTYIQPSATDFPQQVFTGSSMNEQQTINNEAYQYPEQLPQENNEVKTNSAKKTATLVGALTPVAAGLYKVVKGAKWSDVFKLKDLGLKIPALAIAGWCIGSLIDGLVSSKTVQKVS